MWTPPRLETERLVLRALTEDDAEAIFEYCSNPNVSRFTLWEPHKTVEDARRFIRDYVLPKYEQQIPEPFGVTLKGHPDRVIGTVGCFMVSKDNRTMELAYALDEQYWGKGIVVEAARAVLEYVFDHYPVERLQCRCKIENAPSSRVMQKLGMSKEGTLRSSIFHRDRFWDMDYYSLLRAEWRLPS